MMRTPYSYGVILAKGEDGRYMAYFPDLPEALTDGADEAEALAAAADCLSEALASRIVDGEQIPWNREPGQLDQADHFGEGARQAGVQN